MRARLRYLFRRVREAPLSVTITKIAGKLRPWFWYPAYRYTAQPEPNERMLESFRTFGALIRDKLVLPESTPLADKALAGDFDCLGYGTTRIPTGDGWHADAFHDFSWPRDYFATCDYAAAGECCDVKVPWEISRLQFLPWLAEAFLIRGSVEYLECYSRVVDDWLDNNPPGFGVNWCCAMEVAIRSVNLSASAAVLGGHLDERLQRRIVASLAAHLTFIERFPETSDVNGNHTLANLMGTSFLAAALFGPESYEASRRIAEFARESDQQFEDAGCHLERALIYHRLCLDMHLIVLAIARRGERASKSLEDTATRALAFAHRVSSNSRLPVIGDSDSGQVLWFGEDPRSILTSSAFLTKDGGEGEITGQLRWLRAIAGTNQSTIPEPGSARTGIASGFLHAQSSIADVVMRAGAQGLCGRASHDHDDALSLWISVAGRDLIVEAGCHSYTLSAQRRLRCIVSSAHNVVRPVDGERFAPVAGSVFQNVRGAPTARKVTHDGTERTALIGAELTPGIFRSCTRYVRVEERSIAIDDCWIWDRPRASTLSWPLAPGVRANFVSDNCVQLATDDGLQADLLFESDSELSVEIRAHDFCAVYGGNEPAPSVEVSMAQANSGALTTRIWLRAIPL